MSLRKPVPLAFNIIIWVWALNLFSSATIQGIQLTIDNIWIQCHLKHRIRIWNGDIPNRMSTPLQSTGPTWWVDDGLNRDLTWEEKVWMDVINVCHVGSREWLCRFVGAYCRRHSGFKTSATYSPSAVVGGAQATPISAKGYVMGSETARSWGGCSH